MNQEFCYKYIRERNYKPKLVRQMELFLHVFNLKLRTWPATQEMSQASRKFFRPLKTFQGYVLIKQ